MTFSITAEEGSALYNAAALRGLSTNYRIPPSERLEMAQNSSDQYADSLVEVMSILLTAFGTLDDGKDKSGDPIAIAKDMAGRVTKLKDMANEYAELDEAYQELAADHDRCY